MPSYTNKPPKTLKKPASSVQLAAEAEPPVSESSEPIEIKEDFVSIAGLASQGRDALVAKLREHMVKSAPKEYVPPAPTERQMSQTQREMEAGRRATERHAAQAANRPQPKPGASEGYTTPVFRPGDSVPGFNSADPRAQNLK